MSVGAYLEAETFTSKVGSLFHTFSDPSRSNSAGMETTDLGASIVSATNATDYLTFDLQVTNGGTVNVYVLSTGPNTTSDGVWLGVDGSDQQVTTGSGGTWTWKKPSATFSLATGTHTLTIKNREDGAQVDKIYLTTGSRAPTGLGGTVSLHLPAGHVAAAPHTGGLAMLAASLNRTLTYQYDGLQCLIGATTSGAATVTYSYTYDLGGNRTSATVNGVTTTRSSNAANQVVGWTYDTVGNLTNDGTTTYGYDALNRQTSTGGITNTYNADGVLVQQGTTRYTQDLIAPLSQILGDGTQTYVYGQERLYAQTGTVKTWYATDALGSVRYTMNNVGVASAPITYDPWGSVAIGSVPTFGFTGELQQGALINLRARWYSTSEGRFGSRDPFAGFDEQPYSRNPYAYALSNPILLTDPHGTCASNGQGDDYCRQGSEDLLISHMEAFASHPISQELSHHLKMSFDTYIVGYLCGVGAMTVWEYAAWERAQAYSQWKNFVQTGGAMDVKDSYARLYGDPMSMFGKKWTSQISGNLLYGFVGKHIGFSEVEIYEGAGVAQYGQYCFNRWWNGQKQNPSAMGPGSAGCYIVSPYPPYHVPIPHTWDQTSDQAQIEAGIILYTRYSALFLAPGNLPEKRKRLAEIILPLYDRINTR